MLSSNRCVPWWNKNLMAIWSTWQAVSHTIYQLLWICLWAIHFQSFYDSLELMTNKLLCDHPVWVIGFFRLFSGSFGSSWLALSVWCRSALMTDLPPNPFQLQRQWAQMALAEDLLLVWLMPPDNNGANRWKMWADAVVFQLSRRRKTTGESWDP